MLEDCVGIISLGEMGSGIAGSLVSAGRCVVTDFEGRSSATVERARKAGVEDAGGVEGLVSEAGVVVSIVPPAAAREVGHRLAAAVRSTGATPLVVDANAISPARAQELAGELAAAGATFVDGDVIGGPPAAGRPPTRLYLSGDEAGRAASVLGTPELRAVVLTEGGDAAASSLKMAYAAWTKGSAALVLTARALARAYGVEDTLLAEWAESQPDAVGRCQVATHMSGRGWRFEGEMEEIAAALRSVGLPAGFAEGAAGAYHRLAPLKGEVSQSVEQVLDLLLASDGS